MKQSTASDPKLVAPFADAHILVVDDDRRLRELLKRYVEGAGYRVTAAGDAEQARRLLAALTFDLLVVDVKMPGESGLSLVSDIRRGCQTPILLLSALSEAGSRIEGLRRGADDYMGKPFLPQELLLRLRSILLRTSQTRETPVGILSFGDLSYDIGRDVLLDADGERIILTGAEARLLKVLARRPCEPLSRESLIVELREGLVRGQERTVDVRVTRLRRKIEPDPANPRYLRTERGTGYMLVPDGC